MTVGTLQDMDEGVSALAQAMGAAVNARAKDDLSNVDEILTDSATLGAAFPFFEVPGFRANFQLMTTEAGGHSGDARASLGVRREAVGSGLNGPASADYGIMVSAVKTGGYASTVDGEIDGISVHAFNATKGDVAGYGAVVEKVGSDGGAVGAEISVRRLNTSGAITHQVQTVNGFSTNAEPNFGSGLLVEGRIGTIAKGILIDTHDERPPGSPAAAPSFIDVFTVRTARDDANTVFKIASNGRLHHGSPLDKIVVGYSTAQHILRWFKTDESTGIASLDQNGNFSVAGQLKASTSLFAPSYTVAQATGALAIAQGAGAMIYVSNESGGAVMAFSDGANWRRVTDRAVIS